MNKGKQRRQIGAVHVIDKARRSVGTAREQTLHMPNPIILISPPNLQILFYFIFYF